LNFWYGAVGVIKQSPVFGAGLGGYTGEFSKAVENTNIPKENKNPHQQYLLIAAQTGLVGLGVFLLSQLMLYKAGSNLEIPIARLWVQIVLISFAAGNLFNSFFLDSGEGLFFAIMVGSALGLWSQNSAAEKSIPTD
jgi:O-antigen ligase